MCHYQETPSVLPYEFSIRDDKVHVHIHGGSLEASMVASLQCERAIKNMNLPSHAKSIVIETTLLKLVTMGILVQSGRFVDIKRFIELKDERII